MKFHDIIEQVRTLLQRESRLSYRMLKREFALNDEDIEDLKAELIDAKRVAADEDGKVLVWVGAAPVSSSAFQVPSSPQSLTSSTQHPSGERRQLTVMFCDVVGSTALSTQLDPEELREVIRAYQKVCAAAIARFEGYLAKYLGDGLLAYFGYPLAHEDDAQRAVRAGLEIAGAFREMPPQKESLQPLQVRIGIHTGLVVVGEMGAGDTRESMAVVGETPNIAARLQEIAGPNTVVISATTQRLIEGQFESQPFGSPLLKGIDTPIAVYHVQSERQGTSPLAGRAILTPFVGREQEVGLLFDRWEQVKEGRGQVVLLGGEPGIGKSRLAYILREHVTSEGSLLYEARCSPYHQHSALYPLIEVMQRTLLLTRQDTNDEKVLKLERALALYNMQETLPLFTALLSLPTPPQYPPLNVTPQKQKERTLQALLQVMLAQAERQATVSVWEDLHWADPSSLEFLSLLIEQLPMTKLLLVLTFRPEFTPAWKPRSHISQLVLNRLGKKQVEVMIEKVAADKELSADVVEQIRVKTDGVPLFVEELTKSVVEAGRQVTGNEGQDGKTVAALGIPATLQEALLARLDRLSTARPVAQLGATLGREFSYELLHAVFSLSETEVQTALTKLVEAEILYQRGSGHQTRYFFKHALIQDTAYQSLLKSTRQQYHRQIAQVLQEQFPATTEAQPELLAHHYTEANLIEHAIPYWQQAGQKAVERSANVEAVAHLTRGLELLKALPGTPARAHQELTLQLALALPLTVTKGYGTPEVEAAATRALELCRQVGETPQLIPALFNAWWFYLFRSEFQTARELAERLISVAQRVDDSAALAVAHRLLAQVLYLWGEGVSARTHLEQALALYNPQQSRSLIARFGVDWGVNGFAILAHVLWVLGYPDQARTRKRVGLTVVQEIAHPLTTALFWGWDSHVHQVLREAQAVQQRAEALIALSNEQGFPQWSAYGILIRGWSLAMQGQAEDGLNQIHQGLSRSASAPPGLRGALLAEAYGKTGQLEEGLTAVAQELAAVNKNGARWWEAELYRLKGELTLQSKVQGPRSKVEEAEECFWKAIEIAQQQQAKSLELRAAMSLARLWQQQGKKTEAHQLLSAVYHWFTEGFDTKDLQEAKALLDTLL
ncbi:MAG: AAA family ATPase [Deltaproteobacteria bacterium]|nr:AAA family ATPase [Deltaproteobacteria bacterium]